jgi:lipopolysaccharide transport system ATP-binding protein
MSPILEVRHIGKSFRDYGSEWKRIASWFGVDVNLKEEHTILEDISFSIAPGEAVGIVGQNGAGKSTLLKIITGTLKPSQGTVVSSGRISAILELGMGFHPDLTGRQNVYHAAGLMGFKPEEIDAVIEEIHAFTEIGDYFDQPVRTYSSGMQMRVSFAVATAYRPEILIIDEALSVGDTYFQHKSFGRIKAFQEEGTTLLFVSHDRGAVQAVCDRAILLESGKVLKDGNPEIVMDYYNALIAEKENGKIEQVILDDGRVETVSGTGEVHIEMVALHDASDEAVEFINVGDAVTLCINVEVKEDIDELVIGYMIKDRLGQPVFGTNTHYLGASLEKLEKGKKVYYRFSFNANIGVGSYSISVAAHAGQDHLIHNYEWKDNAFIFEVIHANKNRLIGTAWIPPELEYKEYI